MALLNFLNRTAFKQRNQLSELVELVKTKDNKKIISLLQTKTVSKNPAAIPYTADAISKDLECIYEYARKHNPSDNELAALISVIMLHKPIRAINKHLSENGYESIPDSRIIYMGTYVETLKSLREFADAKISKYEISAVMDQRTCPICRKHDGKRHLVSKAVIGKNAPPFCEECRCCIMAVFK